MYSLVAAVLLSVCIARGSAITCGSVPQCQKTSSGCWIPNSNAKKLQCSVGCNGVTSPKINLQSIVAKQNGHDVSGYGISVKTPMYLTITGKNNYGRVANPLVDVTLSYCGHPLFGSSCNWQNQPTLGLTSNLNPCDQSSGILIDDCHLSDPSNPVINLTVDLTKNKLLAPFLGLLHVNTDYQLQVTLKDGNTKLVCVDAEDRLLDN